MATVLERRVDQFRRFNRFFTQRIGVLTDNFLRTPYTLAESRVLFELANRENTSPGDLAAASDIDPGYLSRILQRFERTGLVTRTASPTDGRRSILALTAAGHAAFTPLNERQHDDVIALLTPLSDERQERVMNAMTTIVEALAPDGAAGDIVLRDPEVGDYGWVIERHGALYGAEYGFNANMERYVAEVIAAFIAGFQPGLQQDDPVDALDPHRRSRDLRQRRLHPHRHRLQRPLGPAPHQRNLGTRPLGLRCDQL